MTDANRRIWHRAGPVAAIGALLVSATAQGCGGDSATGAGGSGGTTGSSTGTHMNTTGNSMSNGGGNTTGTNMTGGGGTGAGGGAGAGTPTLSKAANDASFLSPFDATPDPSAGSIYFTCVDAAGDPAVFKVAAAGGTATELVHGAPLVAPFGITTDDAGTHLFVADTGAGTKDHGAILSMTSSGGSPTAVMGTDGMAPRGVDVITQNSVELIYFTGADATTGVPGVYKVKTSGAGPTLVNTSGTTFVDPSGISAASNGDVYVADTVSSGSHEAQIILVHNGAASVWVTNQRVNYPAGVALTKDEKTLLVSSLDPDAGTDVIVSFDVATKAPTEITKNGVDITKFNEAAGMHRARSTNQFAWVDSTSNATGTVYLIKFLQ